MTTRTRGRDGPGPVPEVSGDRRRRASAAGLACLAAVLVLAADATARGTVAGRVAAVVAGKSPRGATVGVAVYDLKRRGQIYGHNADRLLALASNTKIFTTAAALHELGGDYEFKTRIVASGSVVSGTLKGDLIVRGGGDPNISGRSHGGDRLAVLRGWARAVHAAGIRRVTGDLVADDSFFDRQWVAPGWPRGQLLWWYAAPVGALSLNDNCVDVTVSGGARSGAKVAARIFPAVRGVRLINRCRTVGAGAAAGVRFARVGGSLTFEVGGSIRARRSRSEDLTVADPGIFLITAFAHALTGQGVRVDGKLRRVAAGEPKRPQRVLHVEKSRLIDSIRVANTRSQNFYAEQILKTLGAEKLHRGTFVDGVRAIARFHRKIGLAPGRVYLYDGSGLSRRNRARPSALVHVLAWMARSRHAKVFRESLAESGDAEGTLRRRLHRPPCKGRVVAKTGTIAGVSALSGYVKAADGRDYAFSVLCNDLRSAGQAQARAFQDAVCRAIIGAR